MKKIILITSTFPYEGGEQFLETEINYYNDIDLIIMPQNRKNKSRNLYVPVNIDPFLYDNRYKRHRFFYIVKSMWNRVFFKEVFSEKLFTFKKIKIFLHSMYLYQMYYDLFDIYLSKITKLEKVIIYTYWNTEVTYALQSLKRKYEFKLISRIHRGDLYKEFKCYNYMPLKKYFTTQIDQLYTITETANDYLVKTYGFDKSILSLSRLGVEDKAIITKCSKINCLNIISCSYLIEVKQIDKIIDALCIIARKMKHVDFKWVHIGSGVLFNSLNKMAQVKLNHLDNVSFNFLGYMENRKIYDYYKYNEVDVFLNVSKSEGVPVSIMEAMSCHIPVVAPAVGGIADMIENKKNGLLLSPFCTVQEVVEALEEIDFFKNKNVRDSAYQVFFKKYNAKKNYTDFVKNLIKMK